MGRKEHFVLWGVLAAEIPLLKAVAARQGLCYPFSATCSGNAPCSQVGHQVTQQRVPSSLRARALDAPCLAGRSLGMLVVTGTSGQGDRILDPATAQGAISPTLWLFLLHWQRFEMRQPWFFLLFCFLLSG